ncbi:MAG: hypothetical protein WAM66_12605 [Acidobacteriaceae bacterium]
MVGMGAQAGGTTGMLFTDLNECGYDGEGECDIYSARMVTSCNGYSLIKPNASAKLNVDTLLVPKPETASEDSRNYCSVSRDVFDRWLESERKSQHP